MDGRGSGPNIILPRLGRGLTSGKKTIVVYQGVWIFFSGILPIK